MQNKKRRDHDRGDEKSRSQRGRIDVRPELTLIDRIQQVDGTPHVEHPDHGDGPRRASEQSERCDDREDGGNEITIRCRNGKCRRQRGRHDSRNKEAETDEPKRVRNNQAKERFFSAHNPKSREYEDHSDNAKRNETHQNAESEYRKAIQWAPPPPTTERPSLVYATLDLNVERRIFSAGFRSSSRSCATSSFARSKASSSLQTTVVTKKPRFPISHRNLADPTPTTSPWNQICRPRGATVVDARHPPLNSQRAPRLPRRFSDTCPTLYLLVACNPSVAPRRSALRDRQRPDALEHRPEQPARQVTLRQQEPVVAGVLHQAPAGLDEPLLQTGERPAVDPLGQHETPPEIPQVVCEHAELQAHLIGPEPVTGQARPVRGLFAFLDPLLGRAPLVVEAHHGTTREEEVRHDEADAREQLAGMVLDFGDDSAGLVQLSAWYSKLVYRTRGLRLGRPRGRNRRSSIASSRVLLAGIRIAYWTRRFSNAS